MSSRSSKNPARWLAVFVAAAAAAFAQTTTPPVQQPCSLAGVVTNSVTGQPLLRAHVVVRRFANLPNDAPQRYGALTNAEGKFTIAPLPPGSYLVFADRVGFVPKANTQQMADSVVLGPGDKKDDLKLALTPTGAINGRVLDAEGKPVEGATVAAEGSDSNSGATTDDKGQFRIGGLRPGRYRVKASPQNLLFPPETRTDGTEDVHYSPTYYPASLAETSAMRVQVQPAAEVSGIDIRLLRAPIFTASGSVSGVPAGSRVSIQVDKTSRSGFNPRSYIVAKPDGSFRVWSLDPGKYTLVARSSEQVSPRVMYSAPVEIEVAGVDLENIELRLISPFDISGQVRFEDEQARQPPQPPDRPGQQQAAARPTPPRRVMLRPIAGIRGGDQSVDIDVDDSFMLQKVPPGRYHVGLSWGPAYIKAVRLGSIETEGEILDVSNGPAGALTLVVSSLTCEVSGTVTGSNGPVAGARVALVAEEDDPLSNRITTANASGIYKFSGIPPGNYKLLSAEDDAISQIRQARMEDYADILESIELRAGDKLTKDLKQSPHDGK